MTIIDQNHHFIFASCVIKSTNQHYGLICIYGDPHHHATNMIWDLVLNFITLNSNLPMLCMGDLNELMHSNEKFGPTPADVNRINNFCASVKQCGLIDLGYNGPAYTWTNKRFSFVPTYERLDRCLGNAEWCLAYPSTTIYHLPMMYSDHAPILAVLNSQRPRINKPFRFENWQLMDTDYHDIAKQSWQRSSNRDFFHKTKYLAADLRKWGKKKPRNNDILAQIENQILEQQRLPPSQQDRTLQQNLHDKHQDLMAKEETYHIQREKKNWAIAGDRNTSFFHHAITKRNMKNKISHLTNPDGSHSTTPDQLAHTLTSYFTNIFSSQNSNQHHAGNTHFTTQSLSNSYSHSASNQSLQEGEAVISNEIFWYTYSIPTLLEIHDIIKQMRNNAAPGLDGFNAAFYKSSWQWTKDDIYKVVMDFYSHAYMPSNVNHTFITLIPKKSNRDTPQDFRPISLCNVIYKIISKSLANRIKNHLPNYISQAQYAFVANRNISSNIIIMQEIIHSFNLINWKDFPSFLRLTLLKLLTDWSGISFLLLFTGWV